jgi:hypothetical protein
MPYWSALQYVSYICAALAFILCLQTDWSRAAISCLLVNMVGVALNLFGPLIVIRRALPYIRF